ncbi:MAG: hypothetical protein ACR2I7_06325 [Geodermatophilaceae bacterium]
MVEDTPVNTGVVDWPDAQAAAAAVRRMQSKLHRWAGADSSRRFGDLFNLVYDPAFLVHAWQRVSGNTGSKTPGVDRATVAWIVTGVGVPNFLGDLREQLKARTFHPVEVRQVMIPKASGRRFARRWGWFPATDCTCIWLGRGSFWSVSRTRSPSCAR